MIFHEPGEGLAFAVRAGVGERKVRTQDACRQGGSCTLCTRKSLILLILQGTVAETSRHTLSCWLPGVRALRAGKREGRDEVMRADEQSNERPAVLTTLDEARNAARRPRRSGTSHGRLALDDGPADRLSNRSRASWPGCEGCRGPGGRSRPSSSAWPAPWR